MPHFSQRVGQISYIMRIQVIKKMDWIHDDCLKPALRIVVGGLSDGQHEGIHRSIRFNVFSRSLRIR